MQNNYLATFLSQSSDPIWIIDTNFNLVFANEIFFSKFKNSVGNNINLEKSVLDTGYGDVYNDIWKSLYSRAIAGENFDFEQEYKNPSDDKLVYRQISFQPLLNENNKIFSVVCQSRDISSIAKSGLETEKLINSSLDVFCTINEEGNFIYVSRAAIKLWGYSPEELINIPYRSLVFEEDLLKTDVIASQIKEGVEIKTFVNRYLKKDGEIAYNLWSARWDGDAKVMYCVARDGKEHIDKEELVLKSEQRFRSLVQEGSDLIGILSADCKYLYVSPTSKNVLGIEPEEFIGRNPLEFIHPDDKNNVLLCLEKIATQKKVNVEPFRFQNSRKEWRWIETVLTNMLDNPSVLGIVANSRDITDRIEEQHRLKLFESVIANTNEAVFITTAALSSSAGPEIFYINDAFTKMTGYKKEEVLGKSPRILQGQNTDEDELAKVRMGLRNKESWDATILNHKKNGEEFWNYISASPVFDEKGINTHWIAIERDITEQKTIELENGLVARISTVFNEENEIDKATSELCKIIGQFLKIDWVELWTSNLEKSEMQLRGHYVLAPEDEIFYTSENNIKTFAKHQGLIGKVWAQKEQIFWDDLAKTNDFVRVKAAKKIGLKSLLGIPLIFDTEVLGILTVGQKANSGYLQKYMPLLLRLEKIIGSEMQRKLLENDLNYLFNAIPDIVSIGDFKGNFLRINKAGCELLGYSEEEILKCGFENFIHPDDIYIAYKELQQLQDKKETLGFEVRFITKLGEVLWLSWFCKVNSNEGIIYSTAKNITVEKKLKELNRQSNQLAKIGSWEVDLLNQSIFWTEEVHKMHETDANNFKPSLERAINFYREDFRDLVNQSIAQSISTGKPFDFEAVLVTAKKKEVWVRAIGNPEFIDGKCTRIFGSFQDIQERKEAELQLQSLSDNLPGVVFQYYLYPDGTDSLKFVTKGAIDIWGFRPEEVMDNIQLVWKHIEAGGDLEKVKQSILGSVETQKNWSVRWKYIMPNGDEKTHLGLGSPNFMADGTIVFHSVILDISQEVKNQELLNEVSNIAKIGTFEIDLLQGASHRSGMINEILGIHFNDPIQKVEDAINLCRADYQEKTRSLLLDCITSGKPFDSEVVIVTPEKKEKWVRFICSPKMHDGECLKIIGSLQDISSLKETETRLQAISNNLPGVVYQYIIEPDGTDSIRYISGAVEQLWGFTADEVLQNMNLVWDQIKAGGRLEELKTSITKAIETRSKWTTTIKYVKPNGEFRTHFGNGMPTFLADGTVIFNSIILDITQEAKNEQLLKHTTAIAKIGTWELNLVNDSKEKMFWSPMIFELLELDSSYSPTLTNGSEFFIGKNKNLILERMNVLKTEGVEFDEEVLVKTGKGNYKWIRLIGRCDWVNNKINKIHGSFQDIHDKKIAEEQMLSLLSERNDILESIGDAFFAVDKNWIVTYWNKEAEKVLGKNREEIVGKNLWEMYPDAIDLDFYRQYHKAMDTQINVLFEEYYPTLQIWFEVSAYPSKDGLAVYFKDVTLRKEADIRLAQANERFEKVTEATADAIWDWDILSEEFYRSSNIQKFFGNATASKLHTSEFWTDAFYSSDKEVIKNSLDKALQDPNTNHWEEEYRIYNEEGEIIYVIDRGVIIRDETGKAIRMIGAMSNITKTKIQEQELLSLNESLQMYARDLERSNEELEQFAFITSHDLQEPLRMITSFMDQLKRKYADQLDDKAIQYINFATDGARRMKEIILDLLEYSRVGRPTDATEEVDVNTIIAEYRQLRRKTISENSVTIHLTQLPKIFTYKVAMAQIFHALIDNAIKYKKADVSPEIEISAIEREHEWEFTVKDNGIGIHSEFFDKIFIIFQRLHNRNEYEGTGIGLAIAKKQVEFLGGKIWLESTVSVGTTFFFNILK